MTAGELASREGIMSAQRSEVDGLGHLMIQASDWRIV